MYLQPVRRLYKSNHEAHNEAHIGSGKLEMIEGGYMLFRLRILIILSSLCGWVSGCDDHPTAGELAGMDTAQGGSDERVPDHTLSGDAFDFEIPIDFEPPTDLGTAIDESVVDRDPPDQFTGGEEVREPPPWDPPLGESDGHFLVRVLLDLVPISGAVIVQGGASGRWITDERGEAWVTIDLEASPPLLLFASTPEARTKNAEVRPTQREGVTIALSSFEGEDNPNYPYSDPGEPSRRTTTAQCGHCHLDINDAWYESPHRSSARNPIVYDLYTGRGSGWTSEESCIGAGGRWRLGPLEGEDEHQEQCYFEVSALGAFNEACQTPPCDPAQLEVSTSYFGGCADCHAPMVNRLSGGGHDLLSVRDHAFEYGVSCDLCHHVERLEMNEAAGVGGRLVIRRPRERASPTLGGGGYRPLTFGPSEDVSNPRMGLSPRAHYRDGSLCGGCHQHQHEDQHARDQIDRTRWSEGALPNQSTFEEWQEGPLGPRSEGSIPCNECHMPPIANVMNAANLEHFPNAEIGVQGGWPRAPGEVRAHAWWGPRQPVSPILRLSAGLTLSVPEVSGEGASREVAVDATVTNAGAGHGLPTGEPMRHLILQVEGRCDDQLLDVSGGDAVHEIGGALSQRDRGAAGDPWEKAEQGDWLRVTRTLVDEAQEYDGYGAFRDSSLDEVRGLTDQAPALSAVEKGLPRVIALGGARVIAVNADGTVQLDRDLPGRAGDQVFLTRNREGEAVSYAGQSGFTFARVMKDAQGRLMVPHFIAVDITRDNRLRPDASWTTKHRFALPEDCNSPTITAKLIYRPYPLWLAQERGWSMWDRVIREVRESIEAPLLPMPSAEGPRLSVAHEDQIAHLDLPQGWEDDAVSELPRFAIDLARERADDAQRRGNAWPWEIYTVDEGGAVAARVENVFEAQKGVILFNISRLPLAIEPLLGVLPIGVFIDTRPAAEPRRVIASSSAELWVIPPGAGALFVTTDPLDHGVLMAAGYNAHGGRSWNPLRPLGELSASHEESESFLSLPRPRPLRRGVASGVVALPFAEANAEDFWRYQGGQRAGRWRLMGPSDTSRSHLPAIVSLRNLASTALPFSVEGRPHWVWTEAGWSGPFAVSWFPIHSEELIALPRGDEGVKRVGALTSEGPRADWRVFSP